MSCGNLQTVCISLYRKVYGYLPMTDGNRILTIPRHNPVNAFTMGGIVRDAGLSVEDFKKLL